MLFCGEVVSVGVFCLSLSIYCVCRVVCCMYVLFGACCVMWFACCLLFVCVDFAFDMWLLLHVFVVFWLFAFFVVACYRWFVG